MNTLCTLWYVIQILILFLWFLASEISSYTQTSESDLTIDSQTSLKHYFRRLLREHEMLMDYMRTKCRPCRCKKCDKKQRKRKEDFVDSEGLDNTNRRRTKKHHSSGKKSAQKKRHFPTERIHRSRRSRTVHTPERPRNKSAHFRDVSSSDESWKHYSRKSRDSFCRKCLDERGDIDSTDEPWLRGPKMVPEKVRGRRSCGRKQILYGN